MAEFPVNPRKLALISVDLQNVFVAGTPASAPDGPEIVAKVNRLAGACREAGITVIHAGHVTRPDGSNVGVMGELQLRTMPPGPIGETVELIAPTDARYAGILEHVGPLTRGGESVMVRPWPDP